VSVKLPALVAIGTIRTPFTTKEEAPIQGAFRPESPGAVEVFAEFADGLDDIEGFSHLILVYAFDRAGEVRMRRTTFLSDDEHGLWATRHPARPNGIGLTVVRLLGRDGSTLRVAGIDVLDDTPLLDIKPYIRRFDCFPDATDGWFADVAERPKPPDRE
jgi:tRNA-Thr(GGU) m(6)t(6)A37 methyltransferase TsaA